MFIHQKYTHAYFQNLHVLEKFDTYQTRKFEKDAINTVILTELDLEKFNFINTVFISTVEKSSKLIIRYLSK